MSATFRVDLSGQSVQFRFQNVSFDGVRAIVSADVSQDIAARAAKVQNLADLSDKEAATNNLLFLQAGTGAVSEALRTFLRSLPISVKSYGAVADGSTDCTTAVTNALARLSALGGGVLRFPKGSYALASASLTTGLTVPSNVTIDLEGSTLTVTGSAQTDCVFRCENKDRVVIKNGKLVGNSVSTGENNGAAISFLMTADATANISGPIIENIVLDNFKAPRWISIQNNDTTYEIVGGNVSVEAISRTGNSQGGTTANLSHVVVVDGNLGPIKAIDVYVEAEATYIKGAAFFFGEVQDSTLRYVCYNAGSSGTNDTACYAGSCYDSSLKGMRNIRVYPTAISPRDCGLYLAAGDGIDVFSPYVSGQTSTADTSLPKGAISINGTFNVTIHGGTLTDNAIGIAIIPNAADATHAEANIQIVGTSNRRATSQAVRIAPYGVVSGGVHFVGGVHHAVSSGGDGRALQIVNNTGTNYINNVTSDGTDFLSDGNFGVALNPLNVTTAAGDYTFSGGRITGVNTCLDASKLTGRVSFRGGIEFIGAGGTTYGLLTQDATNVDIDGVVISGSFAAFGLSLYTTSGTLRNVRRNTSSNFCTGLGMAAPTHSGQAGQIVENMDPAAAEYIGWVCTGGTNWKGYGVIAA